MKTDTIIHSEKRFYLSLAVVAALHFFLFGAAIYLQLREIPRQLTPQIVTITLVSAPASSGEQGSSTKTEPPEAVVASPASQPVIKKDVQKVKVMPVPVAKKTDTVHPSSSNQDVAKEKSALLTGVERQASINKALDHIKQRVDGQVEPQQSRNSLNNALERLQQKLKVEKAAAGSVNGSGGTSSGAGKVASGGGLSYTYKAEIKAIIQKNWTFSKTFLKNSEGMEVKTRIHILADGTIDQIIFDKKAASDYLNNSITKAIEKSSPLPPLPKEYGTDNIWIGFVFTPAGIGSSR